LMDYWKDQLADAPVALHMPAGQPRLRPSRMRGQRQTLRMPTWLLQELQVLGRQQNVTLFMTLLAAWTTLLHRYSGEEDILISTFTANRNRPEVERLIGCFTNILLVLRHDLGGDPSFTELLNRVRKTTLDAFSHSELPIEILRKELYVDRPIGFTMQTAARSSLELDGLQVEKFGTARGGPPSFLRLAMIEGDGDLTARLHYDSNIFEAATIQRMLGDFQSLLEGIVADPEKRISGLPLLTESERLAPGEAQRWGRPVHPAQARRSWSIRFRKRLRWSLRHARRGAGRFLRAGQAWPLVGSLLARTEGVFGHLLSPLVTEPFRVPSAGLLGDVVRRESGEPPRASLVAIRRHGSRPPFFGVPGNRDALCFHALAQRLGSDQPFYGFQPQDHDKERTNLPEIEDIAANYVREVRSLQPEGPYFLGGHSSGGLVAFEMARQLRSQGRDVALLALFDTELRAKVPIKRRLRLQSRRLRREGPLGYVRRMTKSMLWTIAYGVWLRFGHSLPPHLSSTAFASMRAAGSYKAQSYPGRVTLFRVAEPWKESGRDPHLGWDGVAAGGVEVYEVPGDHSTLLEEPHVQILAAQLKSCLDQTQADSS
jgi:thioesterase domain-containing protein